MSLFVMMADSCFLWREFQVSRLIYTNSGSGVLALASNAVHKLWKWQKSDHNLAGKVSSPPWFSFLVHFLFVYGYDHFSNYILRLFSSRQRLMHNQYYGNLQVGLWWPMRQVMQTLKTLFLVSPCQRMTPTLCQRQEGKSPCSTWWHSRWT